MQVTIPIYDGTTGQQTGTQTVTVPDDLGNRDTLRQQAMSAAVDNRAFVALATPTNAQVVAQVKALTRQMNGLIRLTLGQLDGTD